MASNGTNLDGTVPASGGKILVLPGDHIGPEVVAEALKVLDIIEEETGRKFEREFDLCGGAALDKHKTSVTEEVLEKCLKVDAVFFGSAGGPEWGTVQPNPESGLLRIRDRMQVRFHLPIPRSGGRCTDRVLLRSLRIYDRANSPAKRSSPTHPSKPK